MISIRKFKDNSSLDICLNIAHINNKDTLNIFSDASMRGNGSNIAGCYGAVAVHQDTIIDELIRVNSSSTVNANEIRGLRCSLNLALLYRSQFPCINIFSDSQIAVFGLKYYIYNWKYDPKTDKFYTKSSGFVEKAKNQELYIECLHLLKELCKYNNVNIFHQKGHVDPKNLALATNVFRKSNSITCNIDYNFIRYISLYNDYIDNKTRSILRRTNTRDYNYRDAVQFSINEDFLNKIKKQNK